MCGCEGCVCVGVRGVCGGGEGCVWGVRGCEGGGLQEC